MAYLCGGASLLLLKLSLAIVFTEPVEQVSVLEPSLGSSVDLQRSGSKQQATRVK